MRLRNKLSGEIIDFDIVAITKYHESLISRVSDNIHVLYCRSIEQLNSDWEEVKPKEPLIKDEKIRKAVRAWAEANGIGGCICKEEIHCITFETERGMFISFEDADPIPPEGNFTIAELCGEERE